MAEQNVTRRRRKKGKPPRCVICGSRHAEMNHVGGRNHVAWFTMPFCRPHHERFHALLRTAGIDLQYTDDPQERILRSLQACSVAQWMFTQRLQELNSRGE